MRHLYFVVCFCACACSCVGNVGRAKWRIGDENRGAVVGMCDPVVGTYGVAGCWGGLIAEAGRLMIGGNDGGKAGWMGLVAGS